MDFLRLGESVDQGVGEERASQDTGWPRVVTDPIQEWRREKGAVWTIPVCSLSVR